MNSMTEKLQRTEQVITEAELRTMLDDEVHWRFWQNPDWSPPDEDCP
jgi:hypothetical protein